MALFANSSATQTAAPGTAATLIFDTDASGIPTGATLNDITIVNTGSVTCYLGGSAVAATTGGLILKPGGQCTLANQSALQSSTTGDIYAITASGTTTTLAGLATVDPVT